MTPPSRYRPPHHRSDLPISWPTSTSLPPTSTTSTSQSHRPSSFTSSTSQSHRPPSWPTSTSNPPSSPNPTSTSRPPSSTPTPTPPSIYILHETTQSNEHITTRNISAHADKEGALSAMSRLLRMEEGYGSEVFKSEGGERAVVVEGGFRVRRVVGVERMEVRRGGRGKSEADTWGVGV